MNFKVLLLSIAAILLVMGTAGIAGAQWPGTYTYTDDLYGQPSNCTNSGCHDDIAANYSQSLHYTYQGIINEWEKGSGKDFGLTVPGGCLKCHNATSNPHGPDTRNCTSCHIQDNSTIHREYNGVGGTYYMNMTASCTLSCHHKRPGANFKGLGAMFNDPAGTTADIHYSVYNFTCWDCHSADELHGTDPAARNAPNQRLAAQVRCEDCHDNSSMVSTGFTIWNGTTYTPTQFNTSIRAHEIHDEKVDCSACHAEWYQHCTMGCHLDSKFEGAPPPVKDPGTLSAFYLGKGFEGEWVPFYNMTVEYHDQWATHWAERSPHTVNKTHDCNFCHGNDQVLYAGDKDDTVMVSGGSLLSVGGITIPINILEVVLPYIVGSMMLVVPIAGVVVAVRRRK